MIDVDLPSLLVGVVATLSCVTAWTNRPSREHERQVRVCSRGYPVPEPESNVRFIRTSTTTGSGWVARPMIASRPFDQDVD